MTLVVSNDRGVGKGVTNLGSMSNAAPAHLPNSLLASLVVHGPDVSTILIAGISIVSPSHTHLNVTSASSSRDPALTIVSFAPLY